MAVLDASRSFSTGECIAKFREVIPVPQHVIVSLQQRLAAEMVNSVACCDRASRQQPTIRRHHWAVACHAGQGDLRSADEGHELLVRLHLNEVGEEDNCSFP